MCQGGDHLKKRIFFGPYVFRLLSPLEDAHSEGEQHLRTGLLLAPWLCNFAPNSPYSQAGIPQEQTLWMPQEQGREDQLQCPAQETFHENQVVMAVRCIRLRCVVRTPIHPIKMFCLCGI